MAWFRSRFGGVSWMGLVNVERTVVKAVVFVAVNAVLMAPAVGQEVSEPAQDDAGTWAGASGSWSDRIHDTWKRLEFDVAGCATVKAGIENKPLAGYKICYGRQGFTHGGNIRSVTLGNDGLPGHLGDNKATIGGTIATPAGGWTGGVDVNPDTGAVKVSAGPAWGFDSPSSPLGAEVSAAFGGRKSRPSSASSTIRGSGHGATPWPVPPRTTGRASRRCWRRRRTSKSDR